MFLAVLDSSRLSEELSNFRTMKQFLRFLERLAFRSFAPKAHHISQIDQSPFLISFRHRSTALLSEAGNKWIR